MSKGKNTNKPIRVLQVIRAMNLGGAETFIMNVYRNIDRTKIQFDFLVSREGKYDDEIKSLGGKIYCIPYLTDVGQIKYVKLLKDFFKTHNEYETTHSHIDQVSGIIVETAKKCGVKNVIAHSHNTKNSNGVLGKIYKSYLQSKINKNTDVKLACGVDAAKWLYKKQSDQAIIINNGIEVDKFVFSNQNRNDIRNEFNISDNTIVIGHIGRFAKQKNHNFLIDIFNEYQKDKDAILMLVGEGELEAEIKNKVNELGLNSKVIFTGPRKDVNKIYSALDMILFPSLHEGLSVVLVEAQCNGLKAIASSNIDKKTDITGNIEFCDIDKGVGLWLDKLKTIDLRREDKYTSVVESGYDIKETAEKLEKIYMTEKKKKILFVTYQLCNGGAERVIARLSNQLVEEGENVEILALHTSHNDYKTDSRIKIYDLSDCDKYSGNKVLKIFRRIKIIRNVIRQSKPDFVIPFLDNIVAETWVANIGLKNQLIGTVRNSPYHTPSTQIERKIRDIICKLCDKIWVQTNSQKEYFHKKMHKKIFVVPNPIDDEVLNVNKKYSDNIDTFITLGRLETQKNHKLLIDAFKEVVKKYPLKTMYIYGEGRLRDELKTHIESNELTKNVYLMTRTSNAISVLRNSDCFVMSSDFEGMPNALMEAMAIGLPCISTDCLTGPRDLIENNKEGLLVSVNDKQELVNAMIRFIENPQAANQMGKAAKQKILHKYNATVNIKKLKNALMS